MIYTKLSVVVEKEDYYLQNAADRSSDEHSMKLGTIKSITFPTGGKTEFEFEANKTNEKDLYGGLRVKSIINKDANGNVLQTKTYDYGGWQPTSDPPHAMMGYETYSWWGPPGYLAWNYLRPYDTCVSEEINPYSNANPLLYSEVTETFDNGEKNFYNYTFYPACDIFCGHAEFGKNPNFILPALNDYGGITPYLTSVVHYGATGKPVTTENYVYDDILVKNFNVGNRLVDLFTYRYVYNWNKVSYDLWFYGYNAITENTIQYEPITAHVYQRNLVAKETIDNVTGVSVREEYTYDDLHRTTLPQTMTAVNSDGKTYTTEYKYTFEDDDPVSQLMAGDYVMPDFLVGERTLCDGLELMNTKTKYVQHGEWFYPEYEYKSVLGGAFFETAHYDGYDDKGNPQTVISNAADTAAVVWGYGSRLPVAQILGLGRSGLSSYASTVNSLETTSSPTLLGGKINDLRTALKGTALVSGYTHKPLFGVASTIGENGYTVNYGYGADARLPSVNDAEGTMQTFAYNVKLPYGGTISSDNYVLTKTYLDASGAKTTNRYQYCDDLGRPVLTADNGVNTAGSYVCSLTEYDQKGRTAWQWLPVAGDASPQNIGAGEFAFKSSTQYGDAYVYTENTYDGADRLSFSATPGTAWRSAGKGKAVTYVTNAANSVKLYHAALSGSSLIKDGYYAAGTLQGETVTDEDGLTLTTFTDKRGRKVLERRGTDNDTYFVYDDLDRLRFVLSPQYQNSGYKAQYAYEYRYDERGNVVKKILPGCDVDQYWYDGANRLTFSSVNDVPGYGYRFMLYDKFGRLCVQGLCQDCERSFSGVYRVPRVTYSSGCGGVGDTDYALYPADLLQGDVKIERAVYYDDYAFIGGNNASRFSLLPHQGQADATGLPTGEIVAASNGQYICSVTAYDAKGRATLISRTTFNGKVETTKFNYTYTGDVASTVHQVTVSGNKSFSAVMTNGYDEKSGKLSSTTEAVSYYGMSGSATVAKYGYDGLGRLTSVTRSGSAGVSSYGYDLHGWPTSVKSKAFEENLHYADGYGETRYSGGISSVEWRNPNYEKLRGYMYYYDALGRLESAVYGEGVGLTTNPDRYNETVLEYTANGAIERFQRRGLKQDGQYGKIDNLNITLNGNRVERVADDAAPLLYKGALDFTDNTGGGTEYTYDGDGRLTGDKNRGIAKIDYDATGYPRRVQFMDGSVTEYVYTAAGEKLRAIHRTAAPNVSVAFGQTKELTASETLNVDSTDYFGSLTAENGEAKIYNFGGGYCTFDGTCQFHYYDRDHQGNIRAVVNQSGTIEQIMNYYPFGAPFCDKTTLNPDLQPYKYNGKEFETMHGRNAYDYGARLYDPLLPTWDRMDPLCEKYYHISPYAYCANDPVNKTDLDGLVIREYDDTGRLISKLGGDQIDFIHQKDGNVKVVNNVTHQTNIIKEGSKYIKGYTHRGNDVSWIDITKEFLSGNGPEKSLFSDFSEQGKGVFESLQSDKSVYTSAARLSYKKHPTEKKKMVKVTTKYANPFTAGGDMWEQMIGEADISWYDLGDRLLFILIDSKSRTSLLYHFWGVENYRRGNGKIWGTTDQTYIWTEMKK